MGTELEDLSFDHYDERYVADPHRVLAELRASCPVAYSSSNGGFWLVTRYEAVREVAHHPETFSSQCGSVPRVELLDIPMPPLTVDPPQHTRIKQALAPHFVPQRVAGYRDFTRRKVIELLAELVPRGRFDASEDFARVVPALVGAELLGIQGHVEEITSWVRQLLGDAVTNPERSLQAGTEVFVFMSDLVAARRLEPGNDLVSLLLAAQGEDERLNDVDLMMSCTIILLAGIDTTWRTLSSIVHHLASCPEDQQRLRDGPELMGGAVEEFLRVFAPVTPQRRVVHDTEIQGQQLHAGDMVLLSLPSANRDDDEFGDGDTIRLDRSPNRHFAFGTGVHRCLGINFARMELSIALEELLRLVPSFRLEDPDAVRWTPGQVRGPENVIVTFDVG